MVRRTVALMILLVSAAGAIGSCSTDAGPAASPTGVAPPSASVPVEPSDPAPSVAPHVSASPRGSTRQLVTPPAGRAPTSAFAVTERHLAFSRGKTRPLPTTVWAPATAAGPFPLIVFSHGLTSEPSAYSEVLSAWAKAGFVVAAPAFPHTSHGVAHFEALDVVNQPADASAVITQMLALDSRAGDPLKGRIDRTRVAAAGHSAGAITTIGMFTGSSRDDRLKAGIVLAGERVLAVPFTGPAAPLLFVHGKLDKTVPYAQGLAAFNAVPWSRAMLTVTKGGHVAITKDFGPVIATTTDFLRWSLYGDAAAKGRLEADATKGGVATFTDQL